MRSLTIVLLALAATSFGQTPAPSLYSGLKWRSIGPERGGRSVAVSGVPGHPDDFYMGTTGGGLWKTTNAGIDWDCVSDRFFQTGSVGAIGVSPSKPEVVYVGMGETDIRGNITHGDGVYKTTDSGKTWVNVGLASTQYISRVRVHPKDPNTVYVGALGHVYGPSRDRGLYKSTDGGLSWMRILDGPNDRSGVIDVAMDPKNPETLYVATWEAWRTPYSLNSGGEGSKMFKSTDGGRSWIEFTRNPGLPTGLLGKINISVSGADSNRVYAIVEALDGGIFRSDDAGKTWALVNDSRNYRQRAWYYTHIYADPVAKDTVYALNVGAGKSTDGGKTFSGMSTPHSDNHDLWIDPSDPKRMINANDGGANVSVDGGKTWTEQDFATAQIYHVVTDNDFPYRVYGAQQDNSSIRVPSRSSSGGGRRRASSGPTENWTNTAGGESGYHAVKPDDPEIVFGGNYGGDLTMLNHRTGESRSVDPWPDNPLGHGAIDSAMRFQWTFPIVFSPHGTNTLYACSQYLLKSTNLGETWQRISPDLTRNDPSTLGPSGGPITKDNTGVEVYATIFTMSESPKKAGTIWCGSDDGLVHLTRDGGRSWTDVTPAGMPKWGLCSIIEASRHDPAVAFLAVDNHENDDHFPYIYRTDDYGKHWRRLVNGIPNSAFVRVVREDPIKKNMLFAGTEQGIFVSFNGGDNWQSLQLNLPMVPVHDLTIKEDDIVAATHGRSFWILDDMTPLRQLDSPKPTVKLFQPRDAYRVRFGGVMNGVITSYYLEKDSEVKLEYLDSSGAVVTTSTRSETAGFKRTAQWLQYPSAKPTQGMILWNNVGGTITAPPGEYKVRMTVGDHVEEKSFRWLRDPRGKASDKDLQEQARFAKEIALRFDEANGAVFRIRELKKKLNETKPELVAKLTAIEEAIYQTKSKSGQDTLNYPIRINDKLAGVYGVVANGDFRPTKQSYEVFKMLSNQLQVQLDELKKLEDELPKGT